MAERTIFASNLVRNILPQSNSHSGVGDPCMYSRCAKLFKYRECAMRYKMKKRLSLSKWGIQSKLQKSFFHEIVTRTIHSFSQTFTCSCMYLAAQMRPPGTTSFEVAVYFYLSRSDCCLPLQYSIEIVSLLQSLCPDLIDCCFLTSNVSITTNRKHLYNIYTTSAERLRRWSNIV